MKSMTGFGRAEEYSGELQCGFKIEISSINKKQFDLKISMPRELMPLEMELRAFVAERIARGSLTLRIEPLMQTGQPMQNADFSKAELILAAAREFQEKHHLSGEITISDLLAIPDAITFQAVDLSDEKSMEFLKKLLSSAIDGLIRMRTLEGANLQKDILERIDTMEAIVNEIQPLAEALPEIQKQRLYKHLKEFDLPVDAVIMSLGTSPNPLIKSTTKGLEVNKKGGIIVNEEGLTSRQAVYAGGDAVTGAATVILAMGAGKLGAKSIDEYLSAK
ncbi:MAG: hypothetical protein BHW35_00275 [Firmicutes bacterium CAG:176_63_11]|nr:MAG: hypothetical protein BHW35_00275 [Firmicutes bacterium CAG:176_63_11]